jgi:hypothetical protein
MPDAGSRAVAVGYPGGVATAFDAATCRLAYAWSGNFLDASGVWGDRGGNPARALGSRFWTAPPGCPWGINGSNEPPDFAAQARDPAFGASLPEGQFYVGPRHLEFQGYDLDHSGMPAFRYRIHAEPESVLEVSERPEPLRGAAGVGVARHFSLKAAARRSAWLLAGEGREPRVLDGNGAAIDVNWRTGSVEMPAKDHTIVLPQGHGRAVVLVTTVSPAGSQWYLRQQGSAWQAILRVPVADRASSARVDLAAWAPYRDEPGLLRELIAPR